MKLFDQLIQDDLTKDFLEGLDIASKLRKSTEILNENYEARQSFLRLKEYFRASKPDENPDKIYRELYMPFCSKYGVANLIKNYYCLAELHQLGLLQSKMKILDLGCGPGIFELAYLLWIKRHAEIEEFQAEITMVDVVGEFLDIFRKIWSNLDYQEKQKIDVFEQNRMIDGEIEDLCQSTDIIIFSSSLGEMLRDRRVNTRKLLHNLLDSNAIIVVIDYGYNALRPLFDDFFTGLADEFEEVGCFSGSLWGNHFNYVDLGNVSWKVAKASAKNSANVQFIKTILVPKSKKKRLRLRESAAMVFRYKEAWENHDLNLIQSLFADNAVYYERDGREPFYGLKNICEYWIENSKRQRSVSFNAFYIDDRAEIITALWQSRFYRKDMNKWMSLRGEFKAICKDGKILEFKERFKKRVTEGRELVNGLLSKKAGCP